MRKTISMRVRTRRLTLSAVAGVLVGSALTFALLVGIGRQLPVRPSASPVTIPLGTLQVTPRAQALPSPTSSPTGPKVSPAAGEVGLSALGVRLTLPHGYRVAEHLQAFTASRSGGETAGVVVTTATSAQEVEYVTLLQSLSAQRVATEAPELLPGRTLTIRLTTDDSEPAFAARFAKTTTQLRTPHGFVGTRYAKVEGLFTSDVTYLTLGAQQTLSVTMAYGVDAPQFDEAAYTAVINSIRLLEAP